MRRFLLSLAFCACGSSQAQQLFPEYLTPSFVGQASTEYSDWDVFYAPKNSLPNYPDRVAPNGIKQSRSAAGVAADSTYSPLDPQAFWNSANPTISQSASGGFVIGAGISGNIYSFSGLTIFRLLDSTPYISGTVVFQFQTEGALMDFDSVRLVYSTPSGEVSLPPTDIIKEFQGGTSTFGGIKNRSALQWDISGLGITSYQIRFQSAESSMSFQRALLDTSASTAVVVPKKRTWTAGGGGSSNWSNTANWLAGALPTTGANVLVQEGTSAVLDVSAEVGEVTLPDSGNFTLSATGGAQLTVNTGFTVPSGGRSHSINAPVVLGGTLYNTVGGGSVLTLGGSLALASGSAVPGGFLKDGNGALVIDGNIGAMTGAMLLSKGVLQLSGTNSYSGPTAMGGGTLIISANAPSNAAGALGTNGGVNVGTTTDSTTDPVSKVAQVLIGGPYSVGKSFSVLQGNEPTPGSFAGNSLVVFGGFETGTGALFSGGLGLAISSDVQLFSEKSGDLVTFSGNISGGSATRVLTKTGLGKVVLSGTTKTYLNATVVQGGTLEIASGVTAGDNAAWTVGFGGTLQVNGTLKSGTGALTLAGGRLTGTGAVNRASAVNLGGLLAPGNGVGTIVVTGEQTWASGGGYEWQVTNAAGTAGTDWDLVRIDGAALKVTASSGGPFYIYLNAVGLTGFDPSQEYQWEIARSNTSLTGFSSTAFAVNADGFPAAYWNAFSVLQQGNSIYLKYTPTSGGDPGPGPSIDPNPDATPAPNPTPAPDGGWLYVSSESIGTVAKYNAATGASIASDFVSGIDLPQSLGVSGSNVLVTGLGQGTINSVNKTSGAKAALPLIHGLSGVGSIAVSGTSLYITNQTLGSVDKYDVTTGLPVAAPFISGLSSPSAIAVYGSSLLVAQDGNGTIARYNAITGELRDAAFITGAGSPKAIAVCGDKILVADGTGNLISRYASNGASLSANYITGLNSPSAMAVYGSHLFVASASSGVVGVYDVSRSSAVAVNASLLSGLAAPVGLTVSSSGASVPPTPIPAQPVALKVSGSTKIKTNKASVKIKGTTSGSVVSVTYRVGKKGAFKKASGTSTWSVNAKKLIVGKNKVTIIATGADGSKVTTAVTVQRTP